MLSSSEKLTLTASTAESFFCFGYTLLIIGLLATRITALKTPFYAIFAFTGIAATLNDAGIIFLRLINQVFTLGPEFGSTTCFLSYTGHVFACSHTILNALQVIFRFTALYVPLKHDKIWSSRLVSIVVMSFALPIGMFSFMMVNQKAIYKDIGEGRLKFAGMERHQEMAKILMTSVFGIFLALSLPMNILLVLKMQRIRRENITRFNKEKMYLAYVLVITVAHVIGGAHKIIWLIATVMDNIPLAKFAQYTYAYPNVIIIFTPPIALILMSKDVRKGMRVFFRRSRSSIADSTITQRITAIQ